MSGKYKMLPAGVKTLANYLEEAGYETAYIGKWPLASEGEIEGPLRIGHDSALHVPLIISGGSYSGGKVVEELVSTESLPRTILALAGVDVRDQMIGENLLDVVTQKDPRRPNRVFAQISESRVGRVIRTPEYLYAIFAPDAHGFLFQGRDLRR